MDLTSPPAQGLAVLAVVFLVAGVWVLVGVGWALLAVTFGLLFLAVTAVDVGD